MDQIFTMKHLFHDIYEQNLALHLLFIDYKQAHDWIDRVSEIPNGIE